MSKYVLTLKCFPESGFNIGNITVFCENYSALPCKNSGFRNPNNCGSCVCPRGFEGILNEADCSKPRFRDNTNETCGGALVARSYIETVNGSINSYSTTFLRDIATCYWHIQAPVGKQVRVKFNHYSGSESFAPCYAFGLEVRTDTFETVGARICHPNQLNPTYEYKSKDNYVIVSAFTKLNSINYSFSYWFVDTPCPVCSNDEL